MTLLSTPELPGIWSDAILAARLLAASVVPQGGGEDAARRPHIAGIHLRARHGPALEAWLAILRSLAPGAPFIRFSSTIDAGRLTGGIDLAATIEAGQTVMEPGLLERASGGFAVLAMAERIEDAAAGAIADRIDRTDLCLIAIDEGADPDERLCAKLADRMPIRADLSAVSWRESLIRPFVPPVSEPFPCLPEPAGGLVDAFVEISLASGARSMRPALALCRIASAVAGLDGASQISPDHADAALRLVLGLGVAEQDESQQEPEERPQDPGENDDAPDDEAPPSADELDRLRDMLVESARARLPDIAAFFRADRRGGAGAAGRAGGKSDDGARGRPVGVSLRPTKASPRPDAAATLRAAAPWQRLRGREPGAGSPLRVRKSDFRFRRRRQPRQSTTIFAVDASGSTALDRLGEAKGAVELLLADCYVRRDQVALIAFRGERAELLMEPTRSLVRAKRSLGSLPGGGATPLADALAKTIELVGSVRRKGQSPLVVLMTDGSGNVALDGRMDRAAAAQDAESMARRISLMEIDILVIDISRRDREATRQLAKTMNADYCRLPRADAHSVSSIVAARLRGD